MEPIRIKIKNFYAIADGDIDFTKFSAALILGYYENNVLMSNGAGKSSIFEAICWVIFNETRQTKVDDVIRWAANETYVEFEFMFGRNTYKITRRRSRIAKESSVSFFTKEGTRWINDSGSTNSETNKKILTLLKIDAKIFLNSVYFKQHDISLFANSSPSDRKEIIKSIMKLEKWDEYQKQAKNKLRFIKDDIDKQLRTINDNSDVNIMQIINEESMNTINNDIFKLTNEQKRVEGRLHSLLELRNERNLNTMMESLGIISKKIAEQKASGKKMQFKQADLNNVLSNNLDKMAHCKKQISNISDNLSVINNKIQELQNINCLYQELEEPIMAHRVTRKRLENTLLELKDTEFVVNYGKCQFCFTDINENNIHHINDNRKYTRDITQKELIEINNVLIEIEQEYKTRKSNKENTDLLCYNSEKLKMELSKQQSQEKMLNDECIYVENELLLLDVSIRAVIEQIQSFAIDSDALKHKIEEQRLHDINSEIATIEENNKNLLKKINDKNIELGTLLKEKEFLQQKAALVNTATDVLIKANKEKTSYDQLVRCFGKEGIQAVFIESVVDELEQYANTTLSHICNEPTVIKLRTQKRTGDSWQETLEIDVVMNGFPQTFESLGGGERFRISLALRIGLSEVLVKRAGGEIKVLLLDEVDSPLDTYGLNNLFENIIKGLEKRFKILVISHNDKLKDRFSDIITVNKTNNGSIIAQV